MTPPSLQDAVGRLTALLQRVEGLTGPDREVDALIACWMVGWQMLPDSYSDGHFAAWEGEPEKSNCTNCSRWPYFTSSLDDALALVERCLRPLHPGMTLTLKAIYSGSREPYWYAEITWPSSERQGRATTPAIALLGALMRSLEQ